MPPAAWSSMVPSTSRRPCRRPPPTARGGGRKPKRAPEAASLSGGNLQKFIGGREILRNPAVLVVSQPTWGVDAGAAAVIRQALLDLCDSGAAALGPRQDLAEPDAVTDRI